MPFEPYVDPSKTDTSITRARWMARANGVPTQLSIWLGREILDALDLSRWMTENQPGVQPGLDNFVQLDIGNGEHFGLIRLQPRVKEEQPGLKISPANRLSLNPNGPLFPASQAAVHRSAQTLEVDIKHSSRGEPIAFVRLPKDLVSDKPLPKQPAKTGG